MNDEYAKDISQKVRSVLDNKKSNGQFIGSTAPYGYLRDPNNKYKFIIDKKAGKVVKKIFSIILSGKSKKEVVEELKTYNREYLYKLNNLRIQLQDLEKNRNKDINLNWIKKFKNNKKVDVIDRNIITEFIDNIFIYLFIYL